MLSAIYIVLFFIVVVTYADMAMEADDLRLKLRIVLTQMRRLATDWPLRHVERQVVVWFRRRLRTFGPLAILGSILGGLIGLGSLVMRAVGTTDSVSGTSLGRLVGGLLLVAPFVPFLGKILCVVGAKWLIHMTQSKAQRCTLCKVG
jgi:hypothetical protein